MLTQQEGRAYYYGSLEEDTRQFEHLGAAGAVLNLEGQRGEGRSPLN